MMTNRIQPKSSNLLPVILSNLRFDRIASTNEKPPAMIKKVKGPRLFVNKSVKITTQTMKKRKKASLSISNREPPIIQD